MLKKLIDELASNLSIAPTPLPDGSYMINFEPDIKIVISKTMGKSAALKSEVGILPDVSVEGDMLVLLSENLFKRETGNAALGLDKDGKKVVLTESFSEDMDYKSFHSLVEIFVNYADAWSEDLVKIREWKK